MGEQVQKFVSTAGDYLLNALFGESPYVSGTKLHDCYTIAMLYVDPNLKYIRYEIIKLTRKIHQVVK